MGVHSHMVPLTDVQERTFDVDVIQPNIWHQPSTFDRTKSSVIITSRDVIHVYSHVKIIACTGVAAIYII